MKVKELKAFLQKFDDQMDVAVVCVGEFVEYVSLTDKFETIPFFANRKILAIWSEDYLRLKREEAGLE